MIVVLGVTFLIGLMGQLAGFNSPQAPSSEGTPRATTYVELALLPVTAGLVIARGAKAFVFSLAGALTSVAVGLLIMAGLVKQPSSSDGADLERGSVEKVPSEASDVLTGSVVTAKSPIMQSKKKKPEQLRNYIGLGNSNR